MVSFLLNFQMMETIRSNLNCNSEGSCFFTIFR
nr:MAG TPA: hypothetical protein [Caudoviricetes sp.]